MGGLYDAVDSTGCPILHVDMDAFYASVMTRDRPELRDLPVVVGGGGRGVVLSANYVARRHGLHSAMPMGRARRLCPGLVVLPPDHRLFEQVSTSVMEIFATITPRIEAASLDEAYLDVRGAARRLGAPAQIAERLRAQVHDEQGITCSVGVAATVATAKLAAGLAKPDGLVVLPPDRVVPVLHPLDVGALSGVGEKTRDRLHRVGLRTVGDVAHTPMPVLQRVVGTAAGAWLQRLAWGTDRDTLEPRRHGTSPEKSMGCDETFAHDTDDPRVVRRELLRLSARVTHRMRVAGVAGRTVTLRVRFADFTTLTRSRTLGEATDGTHEVYGAAERLHAALGLQRARIRLVGVRVEGLVPRGTVQHQLVLGERERGWGEADRAVDRVVHRFGTAAVGPASLLA